MGNTKGVILERFSFAEGSKLCILRTVSRLYYTSAQLFRRCTSHSIFRIEHCQRRGRSSEHFRLPILHALQPLNDFDCRRLFLVPSIGSIIDVSLRFPGTQCFNAPLSAISPEIFWGVESKYIIRPFFVWPIIWKIQNSFQAPHPRTNR